MVFERLHAWARLLEQEVSRRTRAYDIEVEHTEQLLYHILPPFVAAQLLQGNTVVPEAFRSVTIYFSDMPGFRHIVARRRPVTVVAILNGVYDVMDSIVPEYDVYKVETVGDEYVMASGLPQRNGIEHARQLALLSLRLLFEAPSVRVAALHGETVALRIGLHTGSCAAGVVGLTRPAYCLFGDSVNTTSRMKSTSTPLRIHCSAELKTLLARFAGQFVLVSRGIMHIRGKGDMETFWLEEDTTVKNKRQPKYWSRSRAQLLALSAGRPKENTVKKAHHHHHHHHHREGVSHH